MLLPKKYYSLQKWPKMTKVTSFTQVKSKSLTHTLVQWWFSTYCSTVVLNVPFQSRTTFQNIVRWWKFLPEEDLDIFRLKHLSPKSMQRPSKFEPSPFFCYFFDFSLFLLQQIWFEKTQSTFSIRAFVLENYIRR